MNEKMSILIQIMTLPKKANVIRASRLLLFLTYYVTKLQLKKKEQMKLVQSHINKPLPHTENKSKCAALECTDVNQFTCYVTGQFTKSNSQYEYLTG